MGVSVERVYLLLIETGARFVAHLVVLLHVFINVAIIVTIKFPPAMERWTNEQILSFLHLMWENSSQGPEKDPQDKAIDPLHFLPPTNGEPPKKKGDGPLDAKIVVEVAKRAFESFRESGPELLTPPSGASYYEACFGSPLADNAIVSEGSEWPVSTETAAFAGGDGSDHSVMSLHSGSFVAAPSSAPDSSVPDPGRKKRIVDWLCKNMQQINELSQKPFDSAELWKLHQHYFAPVVIENRQLFLATNTCLWRQASPRFWVHHQLHRCPC